MIFSGLFLVSLLCGWCAVSCSDLCRRLCADTGAGQWVRRAVSIVILAAIGGLMVPDFAIHVGLPFESPHQLIPLALVPCRPITACSWKSGKLGDIIGGYYTFAGDHPVGESS